LRRQAVDVSFRAVAFPLALRVIQPDFSMRSTGSRRSFLERRAGRQVALDELRELVAMHLRLAQQTQQKQFTIHAFHLPE
jgi:hypothetical protein